MAPPFNFNGPAFHFTFQQPGPVPLSIGSATYTAWWFAISGLAIAGGAATITCDGTGNYVMTAKDNRTYTAFLDVTNDRRTITSSGFTLAELLSHNPVIEAVIRLLKDGITQISLTYT